MPRSSLIPFDCRPYSAGAIKVRNPRLVDRQHPDNRNRHLDAAGGLYQVALRMTLRLTTKLADYRRIGLDEWVRLYATWYQILKDLSDTHFSNAEKIVLVQDNLNTHKPASLYEAFPAPEARRLVERFEWHYTPKHGSWLDM